MNVEVTVQISGIENATDRTMWNAQERINHFLSDLDTDLETSVKGLLRHWGLDAQVSVAVSR